MAKTAISVTGLSKSYQVGGAREKYRTLQDSLSNLAAAPLRIFKRTPEETKAANTFWALKDVSFDVPMGESLGIIGRNGAGKSTLLKLLSRITEPTSGRIRRFGRVASLLEVGTGFHQELTGRENVYLNGAILGMSRKEIDRKFDQMVAFSEVSRFIDTPVKRYSSGMQLRLAFAVAAHLEPEILIVDEVLAVGDATFQRRCIDRMKVLATSGCTLLFVSHNMEMIPALCNSAIWMQSGRLVEYGSAMQVTDNYLASLAGESNDDLLTDARRMGDGRARFRRLRIVDDKGRAIPSIRYGQDLRCLLEIETDRELTGVSLQVVLKNMHGTRLVTGWTDEVNFTSQVNLRPGRQEFECRFHELKIRPGRQVTIELWMHDGDRLDQIEMARVYDVVEEDSSGISLHPDQGIIVMDYSWKRISFPEDAPTPSESTLATAP